MCCDKFKFYSGEKRILTATVTPERTNETAVIANACFELVKMFDKSVCKQGTCTTEGRKAKVFLDLTDVPVGNYELRVTSDIGVERITKTQEIEVIK